MFLLRALNITFPNTHTQGHTETSFSRDDQAGSFVTLTTAQVSRFLLRELHSRWHRKGHGCRGGQHCRQWDKDSFPEPICIPPMEQPVLLSVQVSASGLCFSSQVQLQRAGGAAQQEL